MKNEKGFTLIEMLLVMAMFAVLAAMASVNLYSFQHKAQLSSTVNAFVADLRNQQSKAMTGYTNGDAAVDNYGINFDSVNHKYTLFKGTYSATNSANFAITIPDSIQITTLFANSQIIFLKGSGEINGYASNAATITITDTQRNEQKVLQLNKLGVVTAIN